MQDLEEDGAGSFPPGRKRSELHLVPHFAPGQPAAESPDAIAIPVDHVELETLRAMLHEQQQETLRAIRTAADLQNKLASAETEVEKIGKQYQGFTKQAGSNNARKTAEIAQLNSHWHNTQRELEMHRRERRIEAVRTAAKVAVLERELESRPVPAQLDREPEQHAKNRKVRSTLIAVAGVAGVIALSFIIWRVIAAQGGQAFETSAPVAQGKGETATVSDAAPGLPPDSPAAFSMAVNRLDDALAAIPGRTPEDILQQVSKNRKTCRLQWNGGHPSLLFDGEPEHANSLSVTIDQCAQAVQHLTGRRK